MPDIPGNSSTTSTITVGGSVTDTLEIVGDHDWIRIELVAGQKLTLTLDGITLHDAYLRIYDAGSTMLAENDDISPGVVLDSRIVFTAPYSGTFYIDAGAYNDGFSGTYQLNVDVYTPPPVATYSAIADHLSSGYWGGDAHKFNVTQGGTITVNLTQLTTAGQNLAREALALWSDVIGVTFSEVTSGGKITFDDSEAGAFSDGTWTNGIISDAHVNISTQWLSDYGTGLNTYSFQTYIHEIGHALGLGHAGYYNGDAIYADDALFANDGWPSTIMSYFDQNESVYFNDLGFSRAYLVTPMLADIRAMGTLYGLSTTTRTGDTTYGFGNNSGRSVYTAAVGNTITALTIFDSGGIDTLDYSGFSSNQIINLNSETFSNIGGGTGNVAIAFGTVIENAAGGNGDDTIFGNSANNVLTGGLGNDTVSYASATAAVTVNIGNAGAQNTVGAGTDTLIGFEILLGSEFDDTLTGGVGNIIIRAGNGNDLLVPTADGDLLFGDAGDDTFISGVGNDNFAGGDGFDTVDYSAASGGVIAGPGTDGGADGLDSLSSIERFIGSNFDDHLRGASVMVGGAGNDTIGDFFGSGQFFGGTGNDSYDVYDIANQVIEVANEGTDFVRSWIASYTLSANVENLSLQWNTVASGTGNALDNVITGNVSANLLSGLAGADTLTGGAGVDTLSGGAGNDTFRDTASGLSGDTITDLVAGDRIVITDATLAGFTFNLSGSTLTYTGGSLTLQGGVSGTLVANAAAGGGVQLTLQAIVPVLNDVRNDFNGDGRSDILWRNVDGQLSNWLGTANGGFTPNNANAAAVVPTTWFVAGTGDFNGDGRDDILWRNVDGQLSNWLGTANGGFTPNNANAAAVVPTAWHVVGTGDFNGDGRDDILWRNDNGTVSDWLGTAAGGFTPNDANAARFVPTDWHVVGTGDFDGDGRDDILWRNDAGQLSDWLGQANGGFTLNDAVALTTVPTAWFVAGTGDFNGDGRDDILWRNTDGTLSNWLGQANGGFTPNDANAAVFVPTAWTVVATGDFNGDGRDDILWRNTDGTVSNWLGTADGGFTPNDANAAAPVPTAWHVQPEPFLL